MLNWMDGFLFGLFLSWPLYRFVLDPVFLFIERSGRGRRP